MATLQQRFEKKIRKDKNGCWIWIGAKTPNGYGMIRNEAQVMEGAHRVALRLFRHVEFRDLEVVDHLCKRPACVNPDHLEKVSQSENIKRGEMATLRRLRRKTHCLRGHALTDDNIGQTCGRRYCRICQRLRWAKYKRVRGS